MIQLTVAMLPAVAAATDQGDDAHITKDGYCIAAVATAGVQRVHTRFTPCSSTVIIGIGEEERTANLVVVGLPGSIGIVVGTMTNAGNNGVIFTTGCNDVVLNIDLNDQTVGRPGGSRSDRCRPASDIWVYYSTVKLRSRQSSHYRYKHQCHLRYRKLPHLHCRHDRHQHGKGQPLASRLRCAKRRSSFPCWKNSR